MRRVVVKLSGHIFDREHLVISYIDKLREVVARDPELRLVVVTGGGGIARRYIDVARRLGASESIADMIGISVSRLNALLLISGLGELAYPLPPRDVEEFLSALASDKKIIVVGGLQPGQSTATVATLLAELSGSKDLIYCANIDAVYTEDPRRSPTAKKLEKVTISQLLDILRETADIKAGTYQLLDQWALLIAKRAGITIYVVDGSRPELLPSVIMERRGYGTVIVP